MIETRSMRRLPVWVVVRRAYSYAWESRGVLRGPYAIYVAVTLAADLVVNRSIAPEQKALGILLLAAEEVFAMSLAVGIHRYVLLGEAAKGLRFFRWDRHFFQYVLTALAILLAGGLAFIMAASMAMTNGGAPDAVGSVLMTGFGFLVAVTLSRLALTLPSAALGDLTPTRQIWQETRGNGLRLLAATLLAVMPFIFAELALLQMLGAATPPMTGGVASGAIAAAAMVMLAVLSPLQLIVVTTALALEYDVLIRGGGPASTPST
jgi:hypothetical protein